DPCWPSVSNTNRTARSRTSGENLFVVLLMMLHPTQELEPPENPVRFIHLGQQPLQGRAVGVAARKAAIVVAVFYQPPALVLLAGHIGGAGFVLGVECVEALFQPLLARF